MLYYHLSDIRKENFYLKNLMIKIKVLEKKNLFRRLLSRRLAQESNRCLSKVIQQELNKSTYNLLQQCKPAHKKYTCLILLKISAHIVILKILIL